MDNKKKDDVFYVCTLIEFIARKTKNHRKDVAGLNHCLGFGQVADELAGEYGIPEGILDVFSSFISDEISDFNTDVYYSNPDYLRCCYEEGYLLY